MKIFEKSYIGIDHNRDDITAGPLAFLTPYEDNAAGAKRRQTVREWLNGYYWRRGEKEKENTETRIVDNKPKAGFRVVDFAARHSTSNKVARVYDPDGYELEISMANLVDILIDGVVEKGEIKSECIWGREGANNWLVPLDSEMYKRALKPGQKLEAEIGDRVIGNHSREYIYLGRGYIQNVFAAGTEEFVQFGDLDEPSWWDERQGGRWVLHPERVVTETAEGKSAHVYAYVHEDRHGDTALTLESRQKPMKITAILGKSDIEVGDNTVCDAPHGVHCTAAGDMAGGRMIGGVEEDPHRWYSRQAMFRYAPFTSDDIDQELVFPQIRNEY